MVTYWPTHCFRFYCSDTSPASNIGGIANQKFSCIQDVGPCTLKYVLFFNYELNNIELITLKTTELIVVHEKKIGLTNNILKIESREKWCIFVNKMFANAFKWKAILVFMRFLPRQTAYHEMGNCMRKHDCKITSRHIEHFKFSINSKHICNFDLINNLILAMNGKLSRF